MIKKFDKLLIICILSVLLTGCWDSEDINKKSITITLGVDYVNDGIEFSGELAKLRSSPSESGEKNQASGVYQLLSYGKNFEESRRHYDSINPYPVFLGATRVVIFGQNYAKEGIEPYLNRIDHLYDYRKTLLSVVSRETPTELFKIKVEKDISVGFLIDDIMQNLEMRGEALYPQIGEILSDIALGHVGYVLPYIGIERGSIKYLGMAVMKDSKLEGTIDLENTHGVLYILAQNPTLVEVIPSTKNEKNQISFTTFIKKRKIKTDYIDEKVIINIDLDLKAQLRYQYYPEPVEDEDIKKLEDMISKKVENDIVSTMKKAKNEFECDFFDFVRYFRAEHPEIYKKIKWEDQFTRADINVNVKTKVINRSLEDPNAKKKY
ncbi:Ger(x)C family spore germination protein [Lutibacter sp. B2]|nr:Ger(x)C family spore germination protein [Lutibacter sp. B2]